jgi:hypothetical protein
VQEPREVHVQLLREGIDTMAKVLRFVAKLHQHKRCLGTREILAEEDEIQPNKRVFKKVRCWVRLHHHESLIPKMFIFIALKLSWSELQICYTIITVTVLFTE